MNNKEELRQNYLNLRNNISKEKLTEASNKITEYFFDLPEIKHSSKILSYISYRNEVNTYPLIKNITTTKEKELFAPYCIKNEKRLEIAPVRDIEKDLATGAYGIPEPKKELRGYHSVDILDIVIVPGVAFSKKGYRIGYGGGYYDRFLDRLNNEITLIGFTYDKLLFKTVPKDSHDRSVDIVISESGPIYCPNKK